MHNIIRSACLLEGADPDPETHCAIAGFGAVALFAELIRQAYAELGEKPPASCDLLEMKMKSNLPMTVRMWKEEKLAEGRAEGIAQGIALGRAEVKAEDLVLLLVARFGTLAPSLRARIRRAKLATLERWFKRAVAASDVRSVFNSPH